MHAGDQYNGGTYQQQSNDTLLKVLAVALLGAALVYGYFEWWVPGRATQPTPKVDPPKGPGGPEPEPYKPRPSP